MFVVASVFWFRTSMEIKNNARNAKRIFCKLMLSPPLCRKTSFLRHMSRIRLESQMSVKIKCSHILVSKQSEALAIMEKLKSGEKFGKLAKELSIDSGSAKKDGNLGYFTKGMMVKPFEDAAFKLQVGETSEPVKSEFGYHIIKRFG